MKSETTLSKIEILLSGTRQNSTVTVEYLLRRAVVAVATAREKNASRLIAAGPFNAGHKSKWLLPLVKSNRRTDGGLDRIND